MAWIKRIYLHQFRNYSSREFFFSPEVNVIIGDNGEGKTNLLEAVFLLTFGRSFRTSKLHPLIQRGASFFYIEGTIDIDGIEETIKLSFDGEKKTLYIGQEKQTQFTPLIGLLPHIVYSSEDLPIMNGSPSAKRRFFDLHLSQIHPLYLHHLSRYYRSMEQRNICLKRKSDTTLASWEKIMADSGSFIMGKRQEFVKKIASHLKETLYQLTTKREEVELKYLHSFHSFHVDQIQKQLEQSRSREILFGTTLHGPHRDDLIFYLQGKGTKEFASEGQNHTLLAALKMAQRSHYEQEQMLPLLSIDDFGAHLDPIRKQKLQRVCKETQGQRLITSPQLSPFESDTNTFISLS